MRLDIAMKEKEKQSSWLRRDSELSQVDCTGGFLIPELITVPFTRIVLSFCRIIEAGLPIANYTESNENRKKREKRKKPPLQDRKKCERHFALMEQKGGEKKNETGLVSKPRVYGSDMFCTRITKIS